MVGLVIERELKECIYGYRSLLLFLLCLVLFLLSVQMETHNYQNDLQEYRLAEISLRKSMSQETTLYGLATYAFSMAKPPTTLEILVQGMESYTPRVYTLRLFSLPSPQGSPASETPALAVFGTLDVLFVFQVVLALGALLFTLPAICGEKQEGTLKLQLANPLPKDALLLGKLIGNLLGLLIPVITAFLASCLLMISSDGVALSGSDYIRLVLLTLSMILYLTVFFALGLCVSALTYRTSTAFALSLAVWVFMVSIVPKAAVIISERASPTESLSEYEMKKADVDRKTAMEMEEEIRSYVQAHPQHSMPRSEYEGILKRLREEQNMLYARLDEDYTQRKKRQANLAMELSRLSPAGSLSFAAMSLARTSQNRDFKFRQALEDYRASFATYYDRKVSEQIARTGDPPASLMLGRQVFDDLPPFTFQDEPLAASTDRAIPDMGLLALWAVIFFAIAYVAFLRYDVR
jgi:ABC-2 type transport system permease protein